MDEKRKEYMKKWREENKDKVKNYANSDKAKDYRKKLYHENKDLLLKKQKEYRDNNKRVYTEEQKIAKKEYWLNNKERLKLRVNEYYKIRRKTDLIFNIKTLITGSIGKALRNGGYTKKSRTHEILGCSYEQFIKHIEKQWCLPHNLDTNGNVWMTWDNHGKYNGELNYGWDIDHKTPLSSAMIEEDIIKLNHYTNLQPLCSFTNRYIKKDN